MDGLVLGSDAITQTDLPYEDDNQQTPNQFDERIKQNDKRKYASSKRRKNSF